MTKANTEIIAKLETQPSESIRAVLDTLYLYNPSAVNELIDKLNGVLDEASGTFLPLAGGTMTGTINYNVKATEPGKNRGLILVTTADGVTPIIGAKTDDNGFLRDVAVIPKLLGTTMQYSQVYANFVGDASNPITRIHAKKIGNGSITRLITIPDGPGTLAKIEDIEAIGGEGIEGQVLTKTADGFSWQDAKGGGDVASVNGQTGEVILTAEDINVTFAGEETALQTAIATLKSDQGELGEQVSIIESKIPETASETNPLVTREDLGTAGVGATITIRNWA